MSLRAKKSLINDSALGCESKMAFLEETSGLFVWCDFGDGFQCRRYNINAAVEESLQRISLVCAEAQREGMKIRGYISTAFGCPYRGDASVASIIKISGDLFDFLGVVTGISRKGLEETASWIRQAVRSESLR